MASAPHALQPGTRVYVAGHRGLVGSAVWRALSARPGLELVGRTSSELDLRDRRGVDAFMREAQPDVVVLAAARVGGIKANRDFPLDFLSDNLQIQVNVMDAAVASGVQRLLFLGSSCVYPKFAPQPIREDSLLTGLLEPTNDAYAIAKIAGLLQVQAVRRQHGFPWISAMPTNLYGPEDNFDPESSHVLASLIRRYDNAVHGGDRVVTNWGSGTPRREFLHVDDLAAACVHLLENYDDSSPVNVGTGTDLSIAELAELVAAATGYEGETKWDETYPDGTPRKLLDVARLTASGWSATTDLAKGLADTVDWYRSTARAGVPPKGQ